MLLKHGYLGDCYQLLFPPVARLQVTFFALLHGSFTALEVMMQCDSKFSSTLEKETTQWQSVHRQRQLLSNYPCHVPQESGELLARLFLGSVQIIPFCIHRGGKTNALLTWKTRPWCLCPWRSLRLGRALEQCEVLGGGTQRHRQTPKSEENAATHNTRS